MRRNGALWLSLGLWFFQLWAGSVAVGQTLTGYDSVWTVSTSGPSGGFTVSEATIPSTSQGDAFDNALVLFVNEAVFSAAQPVYSATSADSGVGSLGGLAVRVQYAVVTDDTRTLRTFITFENAGESTVDFAASIRSNVGSDGGTSIQGTSSGDYSFSIADRWVVTDDSTSGGDPANTHVLFGAGDVLETPTFVGTTVFDSAGTQGVRADFSLSVAPGATLALLFFNQVSPTSAGALTGAGAFDAEILPTDALLAGLTADELRQVVNFTIPEPAGAATLALLAAIIVPSTLRRRPQRICCTR